MSTVIDPQTLTPRSRRLLEIATDIGAVAGAVADARARLREAERKIADRKIALTPAEGWAGKNAEARAAAEAATYAADKGLAAEYREAAFAEKEVANLTVIADRLFAERQAIEFSIRESLALALMPPVARGAAAMPPERPTTAAIADRIADKAADKAAAEIAVDDIPF